MTICALALLCAAGAIVDASAAPCRARTSTAAVVASCGGFFVPSPIFADLDRAWSAAPAMLTEIDARSAETRELRAALASMTDTASSARRRADLWRRAALAAERTADAARRLCLTPASGGGGADGVFWCAVCALGAGAAAVGMAHASP